MILALLALLALLVGAGIGTGQGRTQEQQFHEAIHLMETKGDYRGAVRLFEASASGGDRALAARALLYAGLCYEKLDPSVAKKVYQRIDREFAEQNQIAAAARSRLLAMAASSAVKNALTMTSRRVWAGPGVVALSDVSADGRYLSYTDWGTGNLALVDLASGQSRQLTRKASWFESDDYALWSAISPDGREVAYTWIGASRPVELRVTAADGSRTRVVYGNEEVPNIQFLEWSPDGSTILAVFERRDDTNQIVLVSTADSSVRVLKTLGRA